MLGYKKFLKVRFVFDYLRDDILQPAEVDVTDLNFTTAYLYRFYPKAVFSWDGSIHCKELDGILEDMCGEGILNKRKIALNTWLFERDWTWSYKLTSLAEEMIYYYERKFR